jgi:autotransporter adhesin
MALGANSNASGTNAVAFGTSAVSAGTGAVAVGVGANASQGNTVLGAGATANTVGANLATALGSGASVTAANSVALGAGSVADRANTVSVGAPGNARQITNVAAGTAGTDAVNVNQLNGVNLEARRGIAAIAALSALVTPSAPGKTTISASAGFFHNQTGVGVTIAHRLNWVTPVVLFGSYGNGGGTEHVGRAGLAVEF